MKPARTVFNLAILLAIAFSLVTITVLFMVDTLVNDTLYSYGLQFSPDWATTYWTTIRTGFVVSGVVIVTAVALQLYFTRITKETGGESETELQQKAQWSTYTLSDGSTIKVQHKLKSAKRLEKHSPDGLPVYVVDYDNIVQVVSVPEKLTKKQK